MPCKQGPYMALAAGPSLGPKGMGEGGGTSSLTPHEFLIAFDEVGDHARIG